MPLTSRKGFASIQTPQTANRAAPAIVGSASRQAISHEKSKALRPRVGVGALSSPLEVGAGVASTASAELAGRLGDLGCDVIEMSLVDSPRKSVAAGRKLAESHIHAVAFVSTSWFEDYLVLDLLEECNVPVLLWALPGLQTGSLCGNQQLTCYLKQLNVPYEAVFGQLGNAALLSRAMHFLRAAALKARLRRARIGLGGQRVAGMTEAAANEIALKKAIGPRIVPLDMPTLLAKADSFSVESAQARWNDVIQSTGKCNASDRDGLDSMKVYLSIKNVVEQNSLDALTIGCYPHLMGRVCLAASLLADQGVPLACEGDVNAAVGQLILTLLTNEPTHNTDWLEPVDDKTVIFSHCGAASFNLAENSKDITLAPVRLMNHGVCALGPAKPGPVTLMNLLPQGDSYRCAVLAGQAVSTDMVFPGNPVRVEFEHTASQLTEWIHDEGIGHHWMIGYGNVAAEITHWAHMAGQPFCLINPS